MEVRSSRPLRDLSPLRFEKRSRSVIRLNHQLPTPPSGSPSVARERAKPLDALAPVREVDPKEELGRRWRGSFRRGIRSAWCGPPWRGLLCRLQTLPKNQEASTKGHDPVLATAKSLYLSYPFMRKRVSYSLSPSTHPESGQIVKFFEGTREQA